jgi:hypothetical protein
VFAAALPIKDCVPASGLAARPGYRNRGIQGVRPYADAARRFSGGATSQELQQQQEQITGPFHEPQTPLGEKARKIGPLLNSLRAGMALNLIKASR